MGLNSVIPRSRVILCFIDWASQTPSSLLYNSFFIGNMSIFYFFFWVLFLFSFYWKKGSIYLYSILIIFLWPLCLNDIFFFFLLVFLSCYICAKASLPTLVCFLLNFSFETKIIFHYLGIWDKLVEFENWLQVEEYEPEIHLKTERSWILNLFWFKRS